MTTKRTKKQTEEVIHYLHEFAEYKAAPSWTKRPPFDKRPSVPEYYFHEGMRVALEIADNVASGHYDNRLDTDDGGWVKTDEEMRSAVLKQLKTSASAALKVAKETEGLHVERDG